MHLKPGIVLFPLSWRGKKPFGTLLLFLLQSLKSDGLPLFSNKGLPRKTRLPEQWARAPNSVEPAGGAPALQAASWHGAYPRGVLGGRRPAQRARGEGRGRALQEPICSGCLAGLSGKKVKPERIPAAVSRSKDLALFRAGSVLLGLRTRSQLARPAARARTHTKEHIAH